MITKELDGLEKCCIYANDFHLEMILLPYIKENFEENKFIIFTENDLEGTIKTLLERTNLPDELIKKKLLLLLKAVWILLKKFQIK